MWDQVFQDVKKNALEKWDYSSAFPSGYAGVPGPVFVDAYNWQLDAQLQLITNGQLTRPVVSVQFMAAPDQHERTFADIDKVNAPDQSPGTTLRLGRRYRVPVLIGCWVDEQLGGLSFARRIASQVHGAMFYYRNRLTTMRHIELLSGPKEGFSAGAQLWVVDLEYEGDVYLTIDV